MHNKTISELAQSLRAKEFSSVELTQHFLNRVKQHADLNAFITVTEDLALQAAQLADVKISKGEGELLTGIPMAHKDIFCTKDVKTTCGSKMLDNFIAPYNATIVEKLNAVGAVNLGKLNMDEFAMGSSNETSFYGAVKNPWNKNAVSGGSSGGSAAAVAAQLAVCTTGSDTGGSIRQPAAFCGVSGIKPTYGRVSRFGMIAYASSLDQGGSMARSAEDCAILLQAMAGFDAKDSTSVDVS
ncbi:MAG: amidase, partial [Methylococcaceae bacterium]